MLAYHVNITFQDTRDGSIFEYDDPYEYHSDYTPDDEKAAAHVTVIVHQ